MFNFDVLSFIKNPTKTKFFEITKEFLYAQHLNYLLNDLSNMFEYKNLPEEIRAEYLEFYLSGYGGYGFGKAENGDFVACTGGRMGNVDYYGIGKDFSGAYPNGTLTGTIGKDVVYVQNNQNSTPDPYLYKYADQLTEIDISIDTLIKNSRAGKVPIADNEQSKAAIENAYKKIYAGQPVAIVNSKPLEKMLNGDSNSYETVDFTDVSGTERIQHLLKAKDDIYRQFHLIYGHGTNGGFKLAQESVAEVTRDNDIAFIYPNIKLKWRKKGIEEINRVFGLNIEVDFSESWKIEHDEVLNTHDDNMKDSAEDPETEPAEKEEKEGE